MTNTNKAELLLECFLSAFMVLMLFSALALAEAEKKTEASAYYQKLLDLHIASVTTKHKVTCNDDIIEGWCAKYNMNKVDFDKGNN